MKPRNTHLGPLGDLGGIFEVHTGGVDRGCGIEVGDPAALGRTVLDFACCVEDYRCCTLPPLVFMAIRALQRTWFRWSSERPPK